MSIRQIEARVCDVTGAVYDGQTEWMTLTHVSSGQEFDFVNFEALEKWVTTDDDDGSAPTVEEFNEIPEEMIEAAQAEEPVVDTTQPEMRPAMTLADAIMMGQKPGFDPTRDRPSDDATRGRG